MDFIEQNKHLLWNWDSWECISIKIIKGNWIFIMLFLTFLTPLLWKMAACFSVARCWPNIISRCAFAIKAFLKSVTAVALRRSLSIIPCITLVSFINVYDEYFCNLMWLSALSPDVCLRQCISEHNTPISNEVLGHKD